MANDNISFFQDICYWGSVTNDQFSAGGGDSSMNINRDSEDGGLFVNINTHIIIAHRSLSWRRRVGWILSCLVLDRAAHWT